MAFQANRYTRVGIKASEGSFIHATYDAASIPASGGDGTGDRATVIANATGIGYFPESAIPKNGALVAVRQLPGAGQVPEVQLYVVSRITLASAVNGVTRTTRATAYGTAVPFSTDTA